MTMMVRPFVRAENVGIGDRILRGEFREGRIDAGRKRGMLKPPDDRGILLLGGIAQIAACLEIAERIETHGPASRRYCA
jgi:hypothetical protein